MKPTIKTMVRAGIASVLLLGGSSAIAVQPLATNSVPFYLQWDNQPGVSNIVWRAYFTTDLSIPTNRWPLFTVMTNAVVSGARVSSTNSIVPGIYYFTVSGSNFWTGETFFSDAAATGGSPGVIPSPVQHLTVGIAGP